MGSSNNTTTEQICSSINSKGLFYYSNPLDHSLPRLLAQFALSTTMILFTSALLNPLGPPSIVPQVLGGIVLGPSCLGDFAHFMPTVFSKESNVFLEIISNIGNILYFFLIGVQMDVHTFKKIGKKEVTVGISSLVLAMVVSLSFVVLLFIFKIPDTKIHGSLPMVATFSSIYTFPVVAHFLNELNLVHSPFGRIALPSSAMSNLFAICFVTIVGFITDYSSHFSDNLYAVCTSFALVMLYLVVIRQLFKKIILKRIPGGESLTPGFIYLVFVGIFISALLTKFLDQTVVMGPLLYGMAIPPGPPLGSALVEKLDFITCWMFMPIYFVKNGLELDIFSVKLKNYLLVQLVILVAFSAKFFGAYLAGRYFKMRPSDAVSLGLGLNIQGVFDLNLFTYKARDGAIDDESLITLCISLTIVAAVITPIIRFLNDPSKRYAVHKGMAVLDSIHHGHQLPQLRIIACIHEQDDVFSTINLLESINPSKQTPIFVYAIHLVELLGRSDPLLIRHRTTENISSAASKSKSIVKAFRSFEKKHKQDLVSVFPFTAISPYAAMHDEICCMALERRVSLIIVPFHKRFSMEKVRITLQSSKNSTKLVNDCVLQGAPCTVAIIVDRGLFTWSTGSFDSWSNFRVAVLFLGGNDDREAVALGARMARNTNVYLSIIRLVENGKGYNSNNKETAIDNEVLELFKRNMEDNEQVMYTEIGISDGLGTVEVIRGMECNYELVLAGRRHDKMLPLVSGLDGWDEETQLGVIGNLFASLDFNCNSTILVVQQHKYLP